MLFAQLVDTSLRVASKSGRLDKVALLSDCLRRLAPAEIEAGVSFLAGDVRQGRVGVSYAALSRASPGPPPRAPTLTVADVDRALEEISVTKGRGSATKRQRVLGSLLSTATPAEREFLGRLLVGELRQGALEGIMVDAVSRAAGTTPERTRRALMFAGDLQQVARAAMEAGAEGLARFGLQLLSPVQPMLAQSADGVDDALGRLDRAGLEYKLDGARIQVHRAGNEVRVFTRKLNDVTAAVPEIVEAVLQLDARELVLDGEAIALREDGRPLPFQTTMRRFGRKLRVEELRRSLPLSAFFFDCLFAEGEALVELPSRERFQTLQMLLPAELAVPRMETDDPAEAAAFLERSIQSGHEGIVAKALDAAYEAGRRGSAWLKVKRTFTLDLIILAAEWGSGRRRGHLSNLHLGAREPSTGGFVMLGKTFKGLTDKMLLWQTERLLALETHREGHVVHVRPELVAEIAFDGVQASSQYPGGVALRFARVKRYRPDKTALEADTIDAVRAIHSSTAVDDPAG
jgi:DNA ligase-1